MECSRLKSVLVRWVCAPVGAGAAAMFLACGRPTDPQAMGDAGAGAGSGSGSGASSGTGDSGGSSGGAGESGGSSAGARCALLARDLVVSAGKGANPAVAWGGGRFGVVWTSLGADQGSVVFALLDDKGQKLSETAVDAGPARYPDIVRRPSGYAVLWQAPSAGGSAIRARLLHDDGTPSGNALPLAQSQSLEARPVGAPRGGDVIVGWSDAPGAFVARLSGGALLDKVPIALGSEPVPDAAGDALGLVWLSGNKLGFSRLSAPLGPLEQVLFRDAPGKANLPRIAAHADGSFDVAWEDDRSGTGDETVYAARIGAGGKVAAEVLVPSAPGSANMPDIAWTGAGTAVAYYQFRDGPPAIFLTRLSADLTRAEEELQVSGDHPARTPRLVWTGDKLGVVYADKDGPVRLSLVSCP